MIKHLAMGILMVQVDTPTNTKKNKKTVIKLISDAINSIVIERQGKSRNRVIEKRKLKKQK